MKQISRKTIFYASAAFGLMFSLYQPTILYAQEFQNAEQYSQQQAMQHHRRWQRRRGGFRLGVCVGQALAQQGVTLPAPTPGQRPSLDDQTKAALKAAVQTCKAEFRGTGSAPTQAPTNPTGTSGASAGTTTSS